jgi:hypothetical protein
MPPVLTTMATITCPHGGMGTTIVPPPPLVVADNGGAVAAEGDAGTLACPFVLLPCAGYTLRSMGLNATTIMGRRVILATDLQTSVTGLPLQISETAKVVDDTSPAPLPADGSPPPADPAMLDLTPPVVVAAPPAGAFNTTTQLPPVLPITFTLSSAFPLQWMLTLLNTVQAQSVDLTSGVPGAVVAPPGGSWSTPSLTVSLLLTAVFLNGLGPGTHQLFFTGVSQRGLSSFANVVLTVA